MSGVDILGYAACVVTALTFLPQVLKTWKVFFYTILKRNKKEI